MSLEYRKCRASELKGKGSGSFRVYDTVLALLSPDMRRISRYSAWFNFPGLSGPAPERIQFPMGAVLQPNGMLMITYGVSDCEAAALTLPVRELDGLLEFTHR